MTDQPILDLDKRMFTAHHGDFSVIGTWSLQNRRPCLVLVPSRPMPTHDRVTPCLVPLDMAFQWDETVGDPVHCATMSYQFASALGLNPLEFRNVIAITVAVREHLGDLLNMPMMPETDREVVADAIMTDPETGKTREAEIVDDV